MRLTFGVITTLSIAIAAVDTASALESAGSNAPKGMSRRTIQMLKARSDEVIPKPASATLSKRADAPAAPSGTDKPAGGKPPSGDAKSTGGKGQKGLPAGYAEKIGASMKEMIDKWWTVVAAGGTVCTPAEVVKVITDAEKTVDPTKDRAGSAKAIHAGMMKLADQRLADAKKGGKSPPKRRALSPEAVQRVAVGVSKTLSSFTEAKKEGQELPTAAQLAQTATEALANVDISDQVATAVALRTAMQTLADKYLADARKGGKGGSGKGGKKASAPGQ